MRLLNHRSPSGRLKVTMPFNNWPVPMINSLSLQDRMEELIEQHLPPLRKTRRRNLARLTAGLYRAGHVHLSAIADEIPGSAKQSSKTRRLRRFLDNEEVDVSQWYRPVAKQLLQKAAESGPLRLLVDTLELTGDCRLLVAALAYRRRALPICWHVDRKDGVTSAEKQEAFLEDLTDLLPPAAEAILIGDGEFHSVDLLRVAKENEWAYCVRLHADTYLRNQEAGPGEAGPQTWEAGPRTWRECRELDPKEGNRCSLHRCSLQGVSITKEHDFGPVNVLYHWAEGEDEHWRLVTNLHPGFRVVRFYRRRMWIEELFGDWQEGTFHLHQTRLYKPEKLSRLVLGLSLVYVWLVAVASYVVKRGWRSLIDRTDRLDRSYLTLGLRWIKRCLRNREPPRMRLQPYF
ncbi:MAG: hypothetical protein BRD37_04315 [Bacteroidetes bacterium QH_8_67_23]|nr:MAG: hypothetical protein BRD37_04315 [Bacteroidetes bacterium QH_8_67_23]